VLDSVGFWKEFGGVVWLIRLFGLSSLVILLLVDVGEILSMFFLSDIEWVIGIVMDEVYELVM